MSQYQSECSVEVRSYTSTDWAEIVNEFLDGSIYQTRSYEDVHSDPSKVSHLVVARKGQVITAAQARVLRVPFAEWGIAYIHGGPMWRKKGTDEDPGTLRIALMALEDEYARKRGLVVRVAPRAFAMDCPQYARALADSGYRRLKRQAPYRTLRVDLRHSLAGLRQNLSRNWRRRLNKAEKQDLDIVSGAEAGLFRSFLGAFDSMLERKRFHVRADPAEFMNAQENLPDSQKMRVFVARESGQVCGGLVLSTVGETAIFLFAATNDRGRETSSGYLTQWHALQWLKENGYRWYDLGGIDKDRNPGVFQFKSGLAGKGAEDAVAIGVWQTHRNYLSAAAVACGEWLNRRKRG